MIRLLQSPWISTSAGSVAFLATMLAVWRPHVQPSTPASPRTVLSGTGASWSFQNPEMDLLMQELKKEKESLAVREKELNDLAARLQTERSELLALTQAVVQVQGEFDQNVTRVRAQETANLKRLAKLYGSMTPEAAAAVFKTMDEATVVKVMTFMKEAETATVLEVMARQSESQAKRVAAISERLRLAFTETKK